MSRKTPPFPSSCLHLLYHTSDFDSCMQCSYQFREQTLQQLEAFFALNGGLQPTDYSDFTIIFRGGRLEKLPHSWNFHHANHCVNIYKLFFRSHIRISFNSLPLFYKNLTQKYALPPMNTEGHNIPRQTGSSKLNYISQSFLYEQVKMTAWKLHCLILLLTTLQCWKLLFLG